jgi:hypothetical protein
MSETVTLEIPDDLARRARAMAALTNRGLEEAVLDWIGRAVAEPPVEAISDEQLLALCESQLNDDRQAELSDLLARQREGLLDLDASHRLDALMLDYRRGLVLKARAWKEAVARGLKPRLDDDAA